MKPPHLHVQPANKVQGIILQGPEPYTLSLRTCTYNDQSTNGLVTAHESMIQQAD
jgi:hypothetical protein